MFCRVRMAITDFFDDTITIEDWEYFGLIVDNVFTLLGRVKSTHFLRSSFLFFPFPIPFFLIFFETWNEIAVRILASYSLS